MLLHGSHLWDWQSSIFLLQVFNLPLLLCYFIALQRLLEALLSKFGFENLWWSIKFTDVLVVLSHVQWLSDGEVFGVLSVLLQLLVDLMWENLGWGAFEVARIYLPPGLLLFLGFISFTISESCLVVILSWWVRQFIIPLSPLLLTLVSILFSGLYSFILDIKVFKIPTWFVDDWDGWELYYRILILLIEILHSFLLSTLVIDWSNIGDPLLVFLLDLINSFLLLFCYLFKVGIAPLFCYLIFSKRVDLINLL